MHRPLLFAASAAFGSICALAQPVEARQFHCDIDDDYAANNVLPPGGGVGGMCPTAGDCDTPAVRDDHIPGAGAPIKTIRLHFLLFAFDDGSSPTATPADVAAQMVQLNADFAPQRIQFVSTNETINDSTFRNMPSFNFNARVAQMKAMYAMAPDVQCNVYVTRHPMSPFGGILLGRGTFPWDGRALTDQGGIIMHDGVFGANHSVLTHEVGHNLGLWHTHHLFESGIAPCSPCYELADGSNGDTSGDFCGDTPPTPVNTNQFCNGPPGADACTGLAWGPTQTSNYMGYNGENCWTQFTPHQTGRMHCWTEDRLGGWLVVPDGPVPGDANGDGEVDISDSIFLLAFLFQGGPAPDPMCAADANGDGKVDISDAIYLNNFLFVGGPAPVDMCP